MRPRKEVWAALALACLSLGVSAWSFSRNFQGGVSQEFCHYAEIGRNILEGKGFRTAAVFPFTLAYLDGRGVLFDADHLAPVLDRFPVQAYLTAAAESVLGPVDEAPAALSALLLAACVAAVFAAGRLLFGFRVGLLAGLLLALDPSFQRGFVLWGLPDFGFCLLTLAAFVLACRRKALPAGIASGLAWLARSNFMLWLPVFACSFWRPAKGRSLRLTLFAIGFLAFSAVGWLYNIHWYGSVTPPTLSWNLAHHVIQDEYPLLSYRVFSSWDAVAHHSPELLRKFRFYLWLHLRDFPTMWQMHLLFPLMLFGAFETAKRGPGRRFVILSLSMLAAHVLAFSFLRYERLGPFVGGRYLIWWAPVAMLLSARGILSLARKTGHPRAAGIAFAAAAVAWFVPYLLMPQGASAHPSKLKVGEWPELWAAASAAGDKGLVVTNLPAQMAWYGRRRAVGLPADPGDLLKIERLHSVDAVLISKLGLGELEQTPRWAALLADPKALGLFGAEAGLPAVSDLGTAVLLSKKP